MTADFYLEGGLAPLACEHCGARVRVKKASAMQTSVQWTRAAVSECAEFTGGQPNALVATCVKLRDSIERAARCGELRAG
ncbi:hypothetical protein [Micromonospora sp. CPCC 206061]|uniref:hypothetical protein n=1 Tax=Micromonospora sp. CPCC 206061 TaxID=3122410 RepID=UPI002FF16FA9